MSLLLVWQSGQTLPGPERGPVTDLCDQTCQRGKTGQEAFALQKPIRGQLEQLAWPLMAEPGPGLEPAAEAKPPGQLMKLPVLIDVLHFGAMRMVGLLPFHVAGYAGRWSAMQLLGNVGKNPRWHLNGMREKRAKKTHRSQLQRKAQTVMLPSPPRDECESMVVKMEMACKLFRGRLTSKTSLPRALGIRQKCNRHDALPQSLANVGTKRASYSTHMVEQKA